MLNRRRFIVGAALIAAAVSYLVYAGIRTSAMYYFELDEFLARRETLAGETLRVKGWVRHGSLERNVPASELRFELAAPDDAPGVPVSYRGIVPDMFAEGREVVVEGRYDGTALTARQIMTSCPSKYEPVVEGGADS